jgi:hypothetical protein
MCPATACGRFGCTDGAMLTGPRSAAEPRDLGRRRDPVCDRGVSGFEKQSKENQTKVRTQVAAHGTKISFTGEVEPPGVGPPAMTYILPSTVAAPSPWRAVGMRRSARQSSVLGS